jgi:hypothetical protein
MSNENILRAAPPGRLRQAAPGRVRPRAAQPYPKSDYSVVVAVRPSGCRTAGRGTPGRGTPGRGTPVAARRSRHRNGGPLLLLPA